MTKTDNAVFYGIREFFVNIVADNQTGLAVWGWLKGILHNSGEGKNVQNSTSLPMLSSLESVFEQFLMESNIFNSQAGLEITHFSSLFLVRNFQFD